MSERVRGALPRITASLPALLLLFYLLLSEPFSILLLFLGALIFHEWGHMVALRLLGTGRPALTPDGVGIRLIPARPLLAHEELIVALAGPLCNILFALFAIRLGNDPFFLLLATVHLLFGLGNLLPFGGCDGERCLFLLAAKLAPRRAEVITAVFSELCLCFFFFFALFLYYLTGNGLCGVFFSLFLLFEEQKPRGNVF